MNLEVIRLGPLELIFAVIVLALILGFVAALTWIIRRVGKK